MAGGSGETYPDTVPLCEGGGLAEVREGGELSELGGENWLSWEGGKMLVFSVLSGAVSPIATGAWCVYSFVRGNVLCPLRELLFDCGGTFIGCPSQWNYSCCVSSGVVFG